MYNYYNYPAQAEFERDNIIFTLIDAKLYDFVINLMRDADLNQAKLSCYDLDELCVVRDVIYIASSDYIDASIDLLMMEIISKTLVECDLLKAGEYLSMISPHKIKMVINIHKDNIIKQACKTIFGAYLDKPTFNMLLAA